MAKLPLFTLRPSRSSTQSEDPLMGFGANQPARARDGKLPNARTTQLDRLYRQIVEDLDQLLTAVGLKAA